MRLVTVHSRRGPVASETERVRAAICQPQSVARALIRADHHEAIAERVYMGFDAHDRIGKSGAGCGPRWGERPGHDRDCRQRETNSAKNINLHFNTSEASSIADA